LYLKALCCVEFCPNHSLWSNEGATDRSRSQSNLVCWKILEPDTKKIEGKK
jgi:hypothetical protein